jgi:hypothetical protein
MDRTRKERNMELRKATAEELLEHADRAVRDLDSGVLAEYGITAVIDTMNMSLYDAGLTATDLSVKLAARAVI